MSNLDNCNFFCLLDILKLELPKYLNNKIDVSFCVLVECYYILGLQNQIEIFLKIVFVSLSCVLKQYQLKSYSL